MGPTVLLPALRRYFHSDCLSEAEFWTNSETYRQLYTQKVLTFILQSSYILAIIPTGKHIERSQFLRERTLFLYNIDASKATVALNSRIRLSTPFNRIEGR